MQQPTRVFRDRLRNLTFRAPDLSRPAGSVPMTAAFERARLFRVLSLFPHPRFTGHAVLDETGLVPCATFTMRTRRFPSLHDRIESIEARLHKSVATYRPDVVVVVATARCAGADAAISRIFEAASAVGHRPQVVNEHELVELFRFPERGGYDQLGQVVTSVFFPELLHRAGTWRRGGADDRRRARPTWKAAAGALVALAEHRPPCVTTLARTPLPPGLTSFIERASRTTTL